MLKELFSYMKQYKKYAWISLVCIAVECIFELVIPLIMADMVDVGIANGDQDYILHKGLVMIGCAGLALMLGICSARFCALCGQGFGANLREAEYRKLQSYSFSNIDHFQVSSLVTRLTSDATVIQNSVSTGIRPLCRAPVMLFMATGSAFVINARLALVFLVALPVLGFLLFEIVSHVGPLYTKMQTGIDRVNRIVQENLTAVRVVRSYVRENYEQAKFDEANLALRTESEKAFGLSSMNMAAMQFVMYGTILAILWFGGSSIRTGTMQVGELTGFLSYVLQILNSLMMLSNVFMMLTRSMASGTRILEVLNEKVEITEEKARPVSVKKGEIRFDHVFFQYSKNAEEYVLSDICLNLEAGQTIGIIGQTGAAKSTLVQLIPRLYEATKGCVYVDDVPVQEYPLEHLRDAIAMVLQKNTLFSGTVRDNLRWGKEDATQEEIDEACRIACVDEFIDRLDNGYDTELGQGGVNVSGGQKQRLCIARAILKQPKVLILDDSTSAVDTATEAKIREGLKAKLPEMTKIIIAQRISSVRSADQIVILDDGKINAVGTHEQLLAENRIYQEIYHSQQEGGAL